MSIKIKNINVKNLGPITELTWDMGNINLIFGDNEKGKSYIVEFLIRSLFKSSGWNLRKDIGSGKVSVEGLSEEIIDFSPGSSKKLEDYLSEEYIGLPPDFSKLLVLRGTNVKLGEEDESDKIMLRRYLSHKEILDKIKEDIQKTVRECNISGYSISGDNRGKIKDKNELIDKLDRIDELFTNVENEFLSGEMKTLEDKRKDLQSNFEELEKSKRYKAFKISEEIKELEEETNKIDEDEIERLIEKVNELNIDKREYNQDKEELKSLRKTTKHYKWLDNAIEEYEKYNFEEISSKPSNLILILLGLMIIITGILIATGLKWFGIGGLVISVIIGVVYKRKYGKFVKYAGKREELKNLKEDFKERFGEELSNLAVMNEKRESMEKDYNKRVLLGENLDENAKNISTDELRLSEEISDLLGEEVEVDEWKARLKKEEKRKRDLEGEISDRKSELSGLQVDESNYARSKPKVEFDWDGYREVENEAEKIQEEIYEKERGLENLKHSIMEHTGDEPSIEWIKLIENLANKRDEILSKYIEITSEIIADKYVWDVIDELYEEEDEKIKDALNSEVIKETLPKVTTHYDDIYLEDDGLIVSDPFGSFPVSTISDGAKEQVFLALRIGLAMEWFKRNELFLILDDAFIHSDKNRRPELVDRVVKLGKNGWQILCFTFDDRIKELFDESGPEYQLFDLNKNVI